MTEKKLLFGDDTVNKLLEGGFRRGELVVISALDIYGKPFANNPPQLLMRNNNGYVYTPWHGTHSNSECLRRLSRRILNGNIESIQVSKRKV
jgi:hypothetical protein